MIISQINPDGSRQTFCSIEWPTPNVSGHTVISRLGNFYRRFIQGFANIQHHSLSLTQKDTHGIGMINRQHSKRSSTFHFSTILLMPILLKAIPVRDRRFGLRYARSYLNNSDDGHWLPVAYSPNQCFPAERN